MIRRLVPALLVPLVLAACGSAETGSADVPAATAAPVENVSGGEAPSDTSLATSEDTGSTPAPNETTGATEPPAEGAVPVALDFTAPLVGGGSFDGATAAGKPLVLWFWAPF